MASLGIDYSFARPDPKAIKASGYKFVCRYVASNATKRISAAECKALMDQGLAICLVFEDYANPKQNHPGASATNAGVADAKTALAQANAIGFPSNRPIYFAVDYDAPPGDQAWIDTYLRGVATVLGANRVGVYGGFYIVKRCHDNGSARWFWQTLAWSGGQVFPAVHIYQNGKTAFGGGADIDEAHQTDYGQWIKGVVNMAHNPTAAEIKQAWHDLYGTEPSQHNIDTYSQKDISWLWHDFAYALRTMLTNSDKALQASQSALKTANDKLAEAEKVPSPDASPTPTPDPNSITITKNGWAALWDAIKGFFSKNN